MTSQAEIKRRMFLRIPVRVEGALFLEDAAPSKIEIIELSSAGVALVTEQTLEGMQEFAIAFSLGKMFKTIRVKVQVRNRMVMGKRVRLGCKFLDLMEADKNVIAGYVSRFVALAAPTVWPTTISLLCFVDALVRIIALMLEHDAGGFEQAQLLLMGEQRHFVMLTLYAFCALAAFGLRVPITNEREKRRYVLSALFLAAACIFTVARGVQLAPHLLEYIKTPVLLYFASGYMVFGLITLFVVISSLLSFRKISTALNVLAPYGVRLPQAKENSD